MLEFMAAGTALGVLLFAVIQVALLWGGQGAVETAAHFAARKFALTARGDIRKAKEAALSTASSHCRNRLGGRHATAALTSIDFSRMNGNPCSAKAGAGDAFLLKLTHWMELDVPWIDGLLFRLAPCQKARIGKKYYVGIQASRLVTVE